MISSGPPAAPPSFLSNYRHSFLSFPAFTLAPSSPVCLVLVPGAPPFDPFALFCPDWQHTLDHCSVRPKMYLSTLSHYGSFSFLSLLPFYYY